MEDILLRYESRKVQPTPVVHTHTAEQSQQAVGLMFSVRPELCDTNRKVGVGLHLFQVFHQC